MVGDKEKYRSAALANFTAFRSAYGYSGNFWRLGNAFDTIIDYFELIDQSPAPVFAQYALEAFNKFSGHWYDDYGWWGLAAGRAAARPALFPDHAADFTAIAWKCWNFFHAGDRAGMEILCSDCVTMAGAPQVWAMSQGRENAEKFAPMKPMYPHKDAATAGPDEFHGVWNCDWRVSADKDNDPCYCFPLAPKDGLGGVQNTVTNALYLSLAARLAGATTDPKRAAELRAAAGAEYRFFQWWFAPTVEKVDGLLHGVNGGSVVRERVSCWADGAKVYGYWPFLAWSGDQGCLLTGLIDYARTTADARTHADIQKLTKDLIVGTQDYLVDKATGLLRPWWNSENHNDSPGGDDDDYETGTGVYMRFLLHAYRYGDGVKALIQSKDCQDFLRVNADNACRLPDEKNSYEKQLIALTNRIAILTAAYALLEG